MMNYEGIFIQTWCLETGARSGGGRVSVTSKMDSITMATLPYQTNNEKCHASNALEVGPP